MSRVPRTLFSSALLLAASLIVPPDCEALDSLHLSFDQTIVLGSAGAVVDDHDVAIDAPYAPLAIEDLGSLPWAADVTAFAVDGRDALFSLDLTSQLDGLVVRRGDVVRYDGQSYQIEFDGAANGLPAGATIDAIATSDGRLYLSFDTTVSLPGGIVAVPHDLVRFDRGVYSLELDGSAVGIGHAYDIDAAHRRGSGSYVVSFDTGGTIGGFVFEDDDLLELRRGAWSLYHDASAGEPGGRGNDLDAVYVPEPSYGMGLAISLAWLGRVLGRKQVRRRHLPGGARRPHGPGPVAHEDRERHRDVP